MGIFSRKKDSLITIPKPTGEEMASIVEEISKRGLSGAIEAAIQKTIDSTQYYQMFENADDQGNYFGTEFNIRATAGRIKKAYQSEPWMFATASLIARTMSSVPYKVINNATDEIDDTHPLNNKLTLGSRVNDAQANNWNGYLDLVLGGNYFRIFNETYTECVQYPVENVALELSADKTQIENVLVYDNKKIGSQTRIPYKYVVHHKYPNPFYPFYGMSIYTAASRPMLLDRFKNEFEMAFYLRGATNAGVIETTEDINKSRMARLVATFEQVYTGKRNWWRTIFLPKGAKWVQSGLTMSEMQHLEGLRENRLTLLAVLGIPPSQVGIVHDVNRATAEAQEKAFWANTIKPLSMFIASGWNNSYLVKTIYGNQVRVEPDFSDIEALQGSLITKGEQAKSVEGYLWIDEIRADILGYDPLPNGAGQKFVAEIKSSQPAFGALSAAPPSQEPANPITDIVDATAEPNTALAFKAQAVASQERIETKLTKSYMAGYDKYLEQLLTFTEYALRQGESVETYLKVKEKELAKTYIKEVEDSLETALNRGFSLAASQSKTFHKTRTKKLKFNETDQQAIDALRDQQKNGQRTTLIERSIDSFVGFNTTRSKEVLDIIADQTEEGKTLDQIAATIRATYGESYKNQAFTVARTELLTAVSQGIKWNHDILGEVFSDVQKQWLHVGDVGSNPDARDWHSEFESGGPKPKDYKWNGVLEYPRDPNAPAVETINCRCSLVSIVPDDAESNAEVILDNL